ncbi:MAG: hypothetical protein AVDCRST_MAG87-3886, partial [uncultured Thermomicrobiales bacterium]
AGNERAVRAARLDARADRDLGLCAAQLLPDQTLLHVGGR